MHPAYPSRLFVFLWCLCACLALSLRAEAADRPPKREFRAVWVATVKNLDYPLQPTVDSTALKRQYQRLLRRFRELGLNAVIFQVRPAGDALYPSRLAPWSAFLTGRQGQAPEGDFDPLAFYIREAHRQGMEFHAWLNPYRATIDLDTVSLARNHPFYTHRNRLLRYGGQFYFNPGLPEVQDYLVEVVDELARHYDIDAVHLDDYFYPYRQGDRPFPDSSTYYRYAQNGMSLDDWRRQNIDQLIVRISERLHQQKPHIRLGISPFGVWRNQDDDLAGSRTRAGVTAFDDTYADVLKWLHRGWIDYIVPQLYWNIGHSAADYEALLDWWSRHTYGRQLYVGLAAYKVAQPADSVWNEPGEIPRQVALIRRNFTSQGSVLFRSHFLFNNPLGLCDSLARLNQHPALLPEWPAPPALPPPPRPELKKIKRHGDALHLQWTVDKTGSPPAYYAIYRFEGYAPPDFSDPAHLLAITPRMEAEETFSWTDEDLEEGVTYTYAVTALNRYHQESAPSPERRVLLLDGKLQRLRL